MLGRVPLLSDGQSLGFEGTSMHGRVQAKQLAPLSGTATPVRAHRESEHFCSSLIERT